MQALPILHIIFYLATAFLPTGTAQFTVTTGYAQKITWVRQADGAWQAATANGSNAGLWSEDGFVVSISSNGHTAKTDLSPFVKLAPIQGQSGKQVLVNDQLVKIFFTGVSSDGKNPNPTSVSFAQDKGGIFAKPAVVTFSTK